MMWFKGKKPIIALAPMADMTDSPFCRICREVAGDKFIIFREMVSAEAIVRDNAKTLKMCEFEEIERPLVQQIFGANPDNMAKAASIIIERFNPDGIDINMGCPVPKIANKGLAGAALMKDHERAVKIVKSVKAVCAGMPLSVKTRLGWSKADEILEFAPKLEQAGADVLVIHGRTKTQGYSGAANWEMIGKVKQRLKIPVISNGDIKTAEDTRRCLEITGADGVMIGRGALGNPWIFRQFPINDLIQVVLRHAELHQARYGERGIVTFRKHLACYFRGERVREWPEIKKFRSRLMRVSDLAELKKILDIRR